MMLEFVLLAFMLAFGNIGGCPNQCNSSLLRRPSCFCTMCHVFADCCSDAAISKKMPVEFSCNVKLKDDSFIYSLSKCKPDWPDDFYRKNCETNANNHGLDFSEKLIQKIPIYSNLTKQIYANIYCAKCNRLGPEAELRPLPIYQNYLDTDLENFDSDPIEILNKKIEQNKNIQFEWNPFIPEDHLRRCFNIVDTCKFYRTQEENDLCRNGENDFRFAQSGEIFKNENCAKCNDFLPANLSCEPFLETWPRNVNSLQLLFDLSYLGAEISLSIKIRINDWEHKPNTNQTNLTINEIIRLNDIRCSFYSQQHNRSNNEESAKRYITICGQIVSIVSLLVLLTLYFSYRVLRNLPGLVLISLSIALVASQICFLLSVQPLAQPFLIKAANLDNICFNNEFKSNKELLLEIEKVLYCYTLGTLIHYFYMAFFFWSNTMAFDLYSTLKRLDPKSKTGVKHGEGDKNSVIRRFWRYSIYSWLSPALLVIALTSKQFINSRHPMSYGYRACFISTNLDLFLFFVLPVSFLLIVNAYFFVACIQMIRMVDKSTRKYIEQEENCKDGKKRLVLFIKLFCLTGMTWILGLANSFTNNSITWYVFIMLNSLQGAMILFSFAFNRKTKNLMKNTSTYKVISSAIGSTKSRSTMVTESTT